MTRRTPPRIPWRWLIPLLLPALLAAGVRTVRLYHSRRHTVAQSCDSDSDCPKPQQCVDRTCCLPSARRGPCEPAATVVGDEVRWQILFE